MSQRIVIDIPDERHPQSVIRQGDWIVLAIHVDVLKHVAESSPILEFINDEGESFGAVVTDADVFVNELVSQLNYEGEDGSTLVTHMIDDAFDSAVEHGARGIKVAEEAAAIISAREAKGEAEAKEKGQ